MYTLAYQTSASRLAQLVERKTLNLVVEGSSPSVGIFFAAVSDEIERVFKEW